MAFVEIIDQAIALLRDRVRISYRVLKREFTLDEEQLADLKDELIDAQRVARDEDGKVLVWVGQRGNDEDQLESSVQSPASKQVQGPKSSVRSQETQPPLPHPQPSAAERRQLTVMFCDLVGSTALSTQLDPEDLRAVVRRYQQTCAEVIQRHEGYIAQYLGDGLLVYFGYPTAHEDDARRAVRAGLEILAAIQEKVPSPLAGEGQGEGVKEQALQVRIGIHSGLVVIGDIGTSGRTEQLALGETPNIAARIQGLAEPNTVIISAATQRLIEGRFESQPFGSHLLKGIATPIAVYHVQSERQGASPLASKTTLTPLVGREQEVGLLLDRWEQAKEGRGQVVLLSGEPGIGKSRLAYTLREHVTAEGSLLFEARCSPYHQHSAFYPLIDSFQRTLVLTRQDTDTEKVAKLEQALTLYNLQESLPLFTALLSLPTPAQYPPLNVTPQKQKERTLQALLQLLVAQAERQATVSVWEDLHWTDPSSLEFLSLLIEQIPTTKLLLVLTFRPEFTPPWKPRSHLSQLVLNRLGKKHVEAMIAKVAESKGLSAEVVEQIRLKTDGVPLFVEELAKSVVEATREQVTGDGGQGGRTVGTLAIPATLQEALLARLDRLSTARQVAQLGATLGREFSHELIQAVTPLSEADLHTALEKLVEVEILYQRGMGEQARYFFKHALIQDTAYQSLLKSTRQQYHQQVAHVLEEQFSQTKETQPELLAHHYTEAGLIEPAIPYWQQAGERATQRSANIEAMAHLTKGLTLLTALSHTPERDRRELALQIAVGTPLIATKGYGSPEMANAFARALELCDRVGDTELVFPALYLQWGYHITRGGAQAAQEVAQRFVELAERSGEAVPRLVSHGLLGRSLAYRGEMVSGRVHIEKVLHLYNPEQHRNLAFQYGQDPHVANLAGLSWMLWLLGYPEQARQRGDEAIKSAHALGHAHTLLYTSWPVYGLSMCLRRDFIDAEARLQTVMNSIVELGFSPFSGLITFLLGWLRTFHGPTELGIAQMLQGLTEKRAIALRQIESYQLALLAEVYARNGQSEQAWGALAEAFTVVEIDDEHFAEAELYRLKGELTLQKLSVTSSQLSVTDPRPLTPDPQGEAEACFHKAIEIARKQQAKSLELRAVMSLSRLWQSQGKKAEAHQMLAEIYGWFTEGFDTKDLQEAKAILDHF